MCRKEGERRAREDKGMKWKRGIGMRRGKDGDWSTCLILTYLCLVSCGCVEMLIPRRMNDLRMVSAEIVRPEDQHMADEEKRTVGSKKSLKKIPKSGWYSDSLLPGILPQTHFLHSTPPLFIPLIPHYSLPKRPRIRAAERRCLILIRQLHTIIIILIIGLFFQLMLPYNISRFHIPIPSIHNPQPSISHRIPQRPPIRPTQQIQLRFKLLLDLFLLGFEIHLRTLAVTQSFIVAEILVCKFFQYLGIAVIAAGEIFSWYVLCGGARIGGCDFDFWDET